jgi:GNAT superfamily N-acetyltransferase
VSDGFRIVRLGQQSRADFDSGVEVLDRYLRQQATQDIRRRVSNCFVALEGDVIAGFYTFAATSISIEDLPIDLSKRLPRYPLVPAALVGRLAVDRRFQGRGLGGALLADALQRAGKSDPAVFALVVDAKDDRAAVFYRRHLFRELASHPWRMFLPLSSAAEAEAVIRGRGGE